MPTDPEIGPALPERSTPSGRILRYDGAEWVSLEWTLRRVRHHSLLAGVAGGALVAIAFLAWQPHRERGPPPATVPAAGVPEVSGAAGPVAERTAVPRRPVVRRAAAPAPRAAEDVEPPPPRDSTENGWFLVEESADAEQATPGAETVSDAETKLDEPHGGAGAASEAALVEDSAPLDPPGEALGEETDPVEPPGEAGTAPVDLPSSAVAEGTESADLAPAADPPPGDGGAPATGHAPDAYEVAAALRERRAAIEGCLAEADATVGSASEPLRRFRLVVVVDPSGLVSNALLNDEPGDSTPLGACLLGIAREMSFAPFEGAPAQVRVALSQPSR